jgi:hypothetical protein
MKPGGQPAKVIRTVRCIGMRLAGGGRGETDQGEDRLVRGGLQ